MTEEPNLLDEVIQGKHDAILDDLYFAIGNRRSVLRELQARKMVRALKPGDRVKITEGIKPKYLIGARATVVEPPPGGTIKDRFIWIELDDSTQARRATQRFGRRVNCPAACLKKINSA